jgi:hypothetical protein
MSREDRPPFSDGDESAESCEISSSTIAAVPLAAASHEASSGDVRNLPRETDILLGRGRPYQDFHGNRMMLQIVAQYKDEYATTPRERKRQVAEKILDEVLRNGTRFLRRTQTADGTGMWEEVDRNAAFDKIWHALRSKSRVRKAQRSVQSEPAPQPASAPSASRTPTVEDLVQDILVNLSQATQASHQLLRAVAAPIALYQPLQSSVLGLSHANGLPSVVSAQPQIQRSIDMMLRQLLLGRIPALPVASRPAPFLSVAGLGTQFGFPGLSFPEQHRAEVQNASVSPSYPGMRIPQIATGATPLSIVAHAAAAGSVTQSGAPFGGVGDQQQALLQAVSTLTQALQKASALPPPP